MKHFNIKITGRVQGVFFRDSTRREANDLGVKGFVKNERDGSVYVEAEAKEEVLNEFVEWCRQGPPASQVDQVDIEEDVLKGFDSFRIAYS